MRNKKVYKLLSVLLILTLLFPLGASASKDYDIFPRCEETGELRPINFYPDDVFDVYYPEGIELTGYAFQLIEGTAFSLDDVENIYESLPERRIYHAPTLEDIRAAFDEDQIAWIEASGLMYIFPPVSTQADLHDRQWIIAVIAAAMVLLVFTATVFFIRKTKRGSTP